MIHTNGDEIKISPIESSCSGNQYREFLHARDTPGSPDIDQTEIIAAICAHRGNLIGIDRRYINGSFIPLRHPLEDASFFTAPFRRAAHGLRHRDRYLSSSQQCLNRISGIWRLYRRDIGIHRIIKTTFVAQFALLIEYKYM